MSGVTGEEIDARRALVRPLLAWACIGGAWNKVHPNYAAVTERRQVGKYSSCGDLAHWMYFRVGVREPWVNRAEHRGWKMGWNVTYLDQKPYRVPSHRSIGELRFELGDVIIVRGAPGTEHVIVCESYDPATRELLTGEFGQPGGARKRHVLTPGQGIDVRPMIGKRTIMWHLPFAEVLTQAAEKGLLVEPDVPMLAKP